MAPPSRCSGNSWTFDQERILIEFFEANSFLWNVLDKDHMNRAMKTAALQECVARLGSVDINGSPFFIESLKGKFTNLRTSFQRELKKVEESRNAAAEISPEETAVLVYTPKWNHYERLLFLKDAGSNRTTSNSDQHPATNASFDNCMFGNGSSSSPSVGIDIPFATECSPDSASHNNGTPTTTTTNRRTTRSTSNQRGNTSTIDSRKRGPAVASMQRPSLDHQRPAKRRSRGLSELLTALRRSASRPDDTPEDLFGKHVAASLKSMPDQYNREKTKLEIQKVIHQHMLNND